MLCLSILYCQDPRIRADADPVAPCLGVQCVLIFWREPELNASSQAARALREWITPVREYEAGCPRTWSVRRRTRQQRAAARARYPRSAGRDGASIDPDVGPRRSEGVKWSRLESARARLRLACQACVKQANPTTRSPPSSATSTASPRCASSPASAASAPVSTVRERDLRGPLAKQIPATCAGSHGWGLPRPR